MASLYANENFPLPAVEALRRLGHDVLTTHESGNAGRAMPDAEVLAYARRQGRILLTVNRRHFVRLHHATADHAGIVVCSFDPDCEALAERVHTALTAQPSMAGTLVQINRPA